jgi:microsomal dipeptidase-like Zn-dependent dipeptidase
MLTFIMKSGEDEGAGYLEVVRNCLPQFKASHAEYNNLSNNSSSHVSSVRLCSSSFAAHINHIRDVAGVNHVGIGAGYDGIN